MGTMDEMTERWAPTRRTWLVGGLLALLSTALVVASATTIAWGNTLRDEGRLLPGTVIASVDVGNATAQEAAAAVEERLAAQLDREVTVTYRDRTWTTTPRDLGVTVDVGTVVDAALQRTADADFGDLLRLRWFGGSAGEGAEVALVAPEDDVAGFVAAVADELDRGPRDATVVHEDGTFVVTEDRAGREVVRDEAAQAVLAAVASGADEVELPVARIDADVPTATAEAVADAADAAVTEVLDRVVSVALEGDTREITARELGARPDAGALVDRGFARHAEGGRLDADDVELEVPADAVAGLLDALAAGKGEAARDAELELSGGRFAVTPERTGRALDREDAATRVRAALAGEADRVDLELATVRPAITADRFDQVLVVRQSERTLELYRDGEVAREWPVAIGTGDHPTPTGTFTVGAKRFEPTWVNPSPTGWGASMPERIGPGPDNPLGARALNWNRGGADTLIRFHGTPNEASIGEAASKGCIRMYNADIVELYDLVPTGTVIVSLS
ncbi:L,D-transpeptidase family protein [Nitriliruptoraceae bacterium ZYF776]|nr:L,D-transpeptidase family protein [Profundirhabdus halotolerans]